MSRSYSRPLQKIQTDVTSPDVSAASPNPVRPDNHFGDMHRVDLCGLYLLA